MPPGVAGFAESGSGASRVHSTKPSGRDEPDATPRLNGSAVQLRDCATAPRITAGPARRLRQLAPSPWINRRRSIGGFLGSDMRIDISICPSKKEVTIIDPTFV